MGPNALRQLLEQATVAEVNEELDMLEEYYRAYKRVLKQLRSSLQARALAPKGIGCDDDCCPDDTCGPTEDGGCDGCDCNEVFEPAPV